MAAKAYKQWQLVHAMEIYLALPPEVNMAAKAYKPWQLAHAWRFTLLMHDVVIWKKYNIQSRKHQTEMN